MRLQAEKLVGLREQSRVLDLSNQARRHQHDTYDGLMKCHDTEAASHILF